LKRAELEQRRLEFVNEKKIFPTSYMRSIAPWLPLIILLRTLCPSTYEKDNNSKVEREANLSLDSRIAQSVHTKLALGANELVLAGNK